MTSDVPACLWGPSRCMDDLCRNSDIGLCGLRDEDFIDDEERSTEDLRRGLPAVNGREDVNP